MVFVFQCLTSYAGLMIEVLDTQIQPGQSGSVDVVIRSDVNGPHDVSLATYEFLITPVFGAVGTLEFSVVQPDTEQLDGDYLFASLGPTGNFNSNVLNSDTYSGGDYTDGGPPYPTAPVTMSDKLLVRLQVTHILPLNTDPLAASGSSYTISLVDGSSDFQNADGDSILFSSISGTVTTTSTVPEPMTLIVTSLSLFPPGWV